LASEEHGGQFGGEQNVISSKSKGWAELLTLIYAHDDFNVTNRLTLIPGVPGILISQSLPGTIQYTTSSNQAAFNPRLVPLPARLVLLGVPLANPGPGGTGRMAGA